MLLRLVLRLRLTFGQRLVDVLGRLVGLSVVVDGYLCLVFLGDAHNVVAVGIYAGRFGLLLLRVEFQVYGAIVAETVFALAHEDLFTGEVIRLLLFAQRYLTPLFEPLGIAVVVEPLLRLLRLLVAVLCLFLSSSVSSTV